MSTVKDLVVEFKDEGEFRIEVPHWEISDRGITVLSGPSGAGKSTLVRALLGLQPTAPFEWNFGETNIAKLPVQQRRLSVVFQSLELFPHLSGLENILFAAKARGLKKNERYQAAHELAEQLSIDSILHRRTSVMSGGERQRVAIARALVGQPRFLFLDEPFSSLDINLRTEARLLVKDVIEKHQIPCLLITHDPQDIESLADQVVYIDNGRILEV